MLGGIWITAKFSTDQIHLPEMTQLEGLIADVVNAILGESSSIVTFEQGYEVQKIY